MNAEMRHLHRMLRERIPKDATVSVPVRLLYDVCPLIERGIESRIHSRNELEAFSEFCSTLNHAKAAFAAQA